MNAGFDILIAEDDENDRFVIERALGRTGIREIAEFAVDGQEAIECLEQRGACPVERQAALLLLDIRMPRVSGFQVLEWLREHPGCRPALVMILSSSDDPTDLARARALGADDYLVKPNGVSAYVKMIEGLKPRFDRASSR